MTAPARPASKRFFIIKAAILAALMVFASEYAAARYRLGVPGQETTCLPYSVFLVDLHKKPTERGSYVEFRSDERMAPHFKVGSKFIKQIRGIPGDTVIVRDGTVTINGQQAGSLHPRLLKKLGKSRSDFDRVVHIQPGTLWVMGTSEDSFDSRYWGLLNESQIIGGVHPLF